MEIVFVLVYIPLCFIAGTIAKLKGRSDIGFFFLALGLSPLVGILAALVSESDIEHVEARQISLQRQKRCLSCAELVKFHANVCKYCGNTLSPPVLPASAWGSSTKKTT